MMPGQVLHDRPGVEQRACVHVRRRRRFAQRDGAVGRRVHHSLVGQVVRHQRHRRRWREARNGLGEQLARQHVGAVAQSLCLLARVTLVEGGNHLRCAVGERGDHGGGGEQHVQHDGHFAVELDHVEVLPAEQDMHLVVQPHQHQAAPGLRRLNMPYPSMVITRSLVLVEHLPAVLHQTHLRPALRCPRLEHRALRADGVARPHRFQPAHVVHPGRAQARRSG